MTRQEAIDFISVGSRTGKLATASPSGRPHVAPVWFVVDGNDLVFTTSEGTVKGRNLRTNPYAAVTVDVSEYPYAFAVVRGSVTVELQAPDLLAWTTRIAERYVPARLALPAAAEGQDRREHDREPKGAGGHACRRLGPGGERHARRAANRRVHIKLREPNSLLRQSIDLRRLRARPPKTRQIAIPHVVDQNEEYVGRSLGGLDLEPGRRRGVAGGAARRLPRTQ